MQPWDFWEALRSQHVCGSTVPTRYHSYLKNSLGNLNITFLFLERFCLQETNLARPSGDVILLMLWTRRWHAGLGSSQKHKDIKSPGFPPLFADVTPLLHYPRWDSASGELSSCGSLPALLQLLILQVGGRKEHDNVFTGWSLLRLKQNSIMSDSDMKHIINIIGIWTCANIARIVRMNGCLPHLYGSHGTTCRSISQLLSPYLTCNDTRFIVLS